MSAELPVLAEATPMSEPLAFLAESPPEPEKVEFTARPLELGFLAQGGRYCTISVYGGGLRVRLPEKAEKAWVPAAARPWLSQRYLYLLPTEHSKKVKSLAERLRRLPERFGLVILGVDPRSSGRWIPTTAWEAFWGAYQKAVQELRKFLEQLDHERPELQHRWTAIVELLARAMSWEDAVRDTLLASFPASFTSRVRPRLHAYTIANPVEVEEAAAQEAQAMAATVKAQAELRAAQEEARILVDERQQAAWDSFRAAQSDVERMLLQVRSIVYSSLRETIAGLEKGGKATGPAVRRLRGILEQFQLLNVAGDTDVATMLARLEDLIHGQSGTETSRAVLEEARQVAESIREDHQAWQRLVQEYEL